MPHLVNLNEDPLMSECESALTPSLPQIATDLVNLEVSFTKSNWARLRSAA